MDELVGAEVFDEFHFALDECSAGGGGLEIFGSDADGQRFGGILSATLAEKSPGIGEKSSAQRAIAAC